MPAGWCNGASAGGAQPPPQLEVDLVGGGDRAEGEASRWGWRSCWSPFCCSHQQGTPWDCPLPLSPPWPSLPSPSWCSHIFMHCDDSRMVYSRSAQSPPTRWSPRGWRESRLTLLIQTSERSFRYTYYNKVWMTWFFYFSLGEISDLNIWRCRFSGCRSTWVCWSCGR